MANLQRQLVEWLTAGLLTADQAEAIALYEAERPGGRWAYYSFLGLGVMAMGIGLISLVAANWEDIPDLVKLATAFAAMLALSAAAWQRLQKGEETLLSIHMFASMALIGLISQVYHTGGKLFDALLFWSVITFFPALLAIGRLTPMLWLSIFIGACFFWLTETPLLAIRYREEWVLALGLALPYICGWLAGLLFRQWQAGFGWALQQWALLSATAVVILGDVLLANTDWHHREVNVFLPAMLLAMSALIYLTMQRRLTGISRTLAMVVILLHLLQMVLEQTLDKAPLLGFFSTVIIFSLAACLAAVMGHQRLFHSLVLLVGVRILIAYFAATGGLAFTAFGLILSGVLIIGAVSLWRRYRHELQSWLEGLA